MGGGGWSTGERIDQWPRSSGEIIVGIVILVVVVVVVAVVVVTITTRHSITIPSPSLPPPSSRSPIAVSSLSPIVPIGSKWMNHRW